MMLVGTSRQSDGGGRPLGGNAGAGPPSHVRNASAQRPRLKPLTIQQIRQAVGGKALTALPRDVPLVKSIFSDSKLIEPFSMFVAIRGARADGHKFLPDAASRGAVAAIVEHPPRHAMPNLHLIRVENTRRAMG